MNSIIVVIDRLHAGYLGCYGNAWIATPELNRLAAESFVFDQAIIDTPQLSELYNSYWLGTHPWQRRKEDSPRQLSLAHLLEQAGIATTLIADDESISGHPLASSFAEVVCVETSKSSRDATSTAAANLEETHLANYFAIASDWLSSAREPFCLWLHCQGLGAPWDAPTEFRRQYAEEDEPLPPDFVDVPSRILTEAYDPDELLGICQAYAGQVGLLDLTLGGLLETLRGSTWNKSALVAVVSARGFPLGEHRRIGAVDDALYGELVQTPWLFRFPEGVGAMDRSQAIVQPGDLYASVLDFHGIAAPMADAAGRSMLPLVRGDSERLHEYACIAGAGGERAIRTPAWYLRRPEGESPRVELYAKPDDRWEVNDVADRCAPQVEALENTLQSFERAAASNALDRLPALDECLVDDLG